MRTSTIILLICRAAFSQWQEPDIDKARSELEAGREVYVQFEGSDKPYEAISVGRTSIMVKARKSTWLRSFSLVAAMRLEPVADDPNEVFDELSLVHRLQISQQWYLLCYIHEITLDIRGPADDPNGIGELLWTYTKQIRPFDPVDLSLGCWGYMIDAPLPEAIPPGSSIHFSGVSRRFALPEIAEVLK